MLEATPIDLPPHETLERVYRQLREAYRDNQLLALPKRVLRLAPWVIFDSWEREPPLANDTHFAAGFEFAIRHYGHVPATINLAHALLGCFDPKSMTQSRFRMCTREVLRNSMQARAKAFLSRADRFGLLREDGPVLFVTQFMQAELPVESVLAEAGLTGQLEYVGFIEHCFTELAGRIDKQLRRRQLSAAVLAQLLSFAEVDEPSGRRLRFTSAASERLVDSLLLPFEAQEPDSDLQALIKRFVLDHFGDPRLKPQRWSRVDNRAQRVIRRWLVAATLEDFFRVLDESMRRQPDPDAERHWPYRRAFWTAYLNHDQISEAWVVLGSRVAADTKHILSEISANYGRLQSSGSARASHAVLILQIGPLIITEWSHSGKYRVWHANNPCAPKFYRGHYLRDDLVTLPDFDGSHHGAENGRWQEILEQHIRKQTGIRISLRELMPRA